MGGSTPTDRLKSKTATWCAFASAAACLALLLTAPLSPIVPSLSAATTTQKRQTARAQFDKAEAARKALEAKSIAERRLSDYQAILRLYRNVVILSPTIHQAPDSIYQAAQLNQAMAQRFPADAAKYRAEARNLYQSLLRQYPQTRYRKQSNQAIAIMESEDEELAAAPSPQAPSRRSSPPDLPSRVTPG